MGGAMCDLTSWRLCLTALLTCRRRTSWGCASVRHVGTPSWCATRWVRGVGFGPRCTLLLSSTHATFCGLAFLVPQSLHTPTLRHVKRTLKASIGLHTHGPPRLVIGLHACLTCPPHAQVNGEWRINAPHIPPYHAAAVRLMQRLRAGGSCKLSYVPRAQNSAADALSNEAVDMQG